VSWNVGGKRDDGIPCKGYSQWDFAARKYRKTTATGHMAGNGKFYSVQLEIPIPSQDGKQTELALDDPRREKLPKERKRKNKGTTQYND
jgi:hypothetical protein